MEYGFIEAELGLWEFALQRYAGCWWRFVWLRLVIFNTRVVTATGYRDWSLLTLCGRREALLWHGILRIDV